MKTSILHDHLLVQAQILRSAIEKLKPKSEDHRPPLKAMGVLINLVQEYSKLLLRIEKNNPLRKILIDYLRSCEHPQTFDEIIADGRFKSEVTLTSSALADLVEENIISQWMNRDDDGNFVSWEYSMVR